MAINAFIPQVVIAGPRNGWRPLGLPPPPRLPRALRRERRHAQQRPLGHLRRRHEDQAEIDSPGTRLMAQFYILSFNIMYLKFDYRVAHLVADLGWVHLDFECSIVCSTLPGPMGIRQKRLGKLMEHRNPNHPNPGLQADGPP